VSSFNPTAVESFEPNQEANMPTDPNHPERVGDWFCRYCKNVNFGFRNECNKCHLERASVGRTIDNQVELMTVF